MSAMDEEPSGPSGPVEPSQAPSSSLSDNPQEPGQQEQPAQQPQPSAWANMKGFIFRMLIMYAVMTYFRSGKTPASSSDGGEEGSNSPAYHPATNVYSKGEQFDLYFYLSENEKKPNFSDPESLYWTLPNIEYGNWEQGEQGDSTYVISKQITASESLLNNGSLFLHVYMGPEGKLPSELRSSRKVVHQVKMLNKFKRRKYHKRVNLLTGTTDVHPDLIQQDNETELGIILSHWHPNLTVNVVDDQTPWTKNAVPPPLNDYINFLPGDTQYQPILYMNDYWNLNSEYMPINETTPVLNLTLTYSPLSLFKWQMYASQSQKHKWYPSLFGADATSAHSDEEEDSLKETMVETNPYLLGLTIAVSIVHSVFEFLAFKNDIQFWKNRQSLEGLSVRSVFFHVFQSAIVLLYILDNETNYVIIISVFVGLLIELWKITKVVEIKVDRENQWFGVIPRITVADKSSYKETETKKYDQMAFKYLSVALFPLLIGYGVYSILYLEHKGWYSWVLNMMYGFLLTFGFIMMTPQLFINYKLKSVAHLPWRMMTYKALNTFIDDLFAFVIKMPTLYRIGCFRDDIVFIIFLYQRWVYPMDPNRRNEFGTSAADLTSPTGEVEADTASPTGEIEGGDRKEESGAEGGEMETTSDKPKSVQEKKED